MLPLHLNETLNGSAAAPPVPDPASKTSKTMGAESATDVAGARRPVPARELGVSKAIARRLAASGVSANAISLLGMAAAVLGGAALALTADIAPGWPLWLVAAALAELRLVANMLDGMVALERGAASKLGELYNEVPDRIADAALLVGLGYAAGGAPALGWAAALAAVGTAYVRAMAAVAGAPQDFGGPMAKPARVHVVAVAAVAAAAAPGTMTAPIAAAVPVTPIELALWLIVVGSVVTMLRRLVRAARHLRGR